MPHVRDALVLPTDPFPSEWYSEEWDANPPAGESGPVSLGDGITVEVLEHDLAEAVMDASEPAGENFRPARQWGQLQSIVREIDTDEFEETHWNFDDREQLNELGALARLVHDNVICSQFAGRVIEQSERRQIAPAMGHERRLTYRLREGRYWLTEAECVELAELRTKYRALGGTLPSRVQRAFRRAERSSDTPHLAESTTHITAGLEALLKTERHGATRQFTTRAPALAAELGLHPSVDWESIYDARSEESHGLAVRLFAPVGWAPPGTVDPDAVEAIACGQDVLRAAIRRSIEDADFRAKFVDADAVRAAWPVP